ncbi:MAG TPA: cell division ATPase MinD [Methanobacteriaceae archaeon]|nr:cell division ATPase MinD [Methanobacteriaceae archaeon]
MSRFIVVASGKGGVGRTSLCFNLGVALSLFGEEVVMLDMDLVMANMDVITGLLNPEVTLHDVLVREKSIEDCVYEVNQGIRVVPTGMHFETLKNINTSYISWNKIIEEIADYGNIFIMDLPAGIDSNVLEALPEDSEIILVTTSTMTSVADALKLRILLNELNLDVLGFVLNMWYDDKFLLSSKEIEALLELPMISVIPYDREMDRALALGRSVVETNTSSPTSNAIMQLSADLLGKQYQPVEPDKNSILNRIKKFVGMLPE